MLMYLHKANVITTNAEAPANAYKENSRHSCVCSDLGTPQIERTYRRIQTLPLEYMDLSAMT